MVAVGLSGMVSAPTPAPDVVVARSPRWPVPAVAKRRPICPTEHVKFEHFALNVPDARAQSRWYVTHVGFQIVRQREEPPHTHFLADDTGRIVIELYTNPAAAIPNYAAAHPLCFHLAVIAADATAERFRLEAAGATLALEEPLPDGSLLIMMRDPWGVPLQLCQRARPFPGY